MPAYICHTVLIQHHFPFTLPRNIILTIKHFWHFPCVLNIFNAAFDSQSFSNNTFDFSLIFFPLNLSFLSLYSLFYPFPSLCRSFSLQLPVLLSVSVALPAPCWQKQQDDFSTEHLLSYLIIRERKKGKDLLWCVPSMCKWQRLMLQGERHLHLI